MQSKNEPRRPLSYMSQIELSATPGVASIVSLGIETPIRHEQNIEIIALIERIAKREPEALDLLYARFQKYILAIAQRMVRSESQAEEVLQDVFLALWRCPPNVANGLPSLVAWLTETTRKQCWLRFRRARREPIPEEPSDELRYSDPILERAIEAQLRVKLENAFLLMPPKHRQILALTYFDGLGPTEIARRLNLPVITVRKRLGTATKRLHQRFEVEVYACTHYKSRI